jgi:hypothetical protein
MFLLRKIFIISGILYRNYSVLLLTHCPSGKVLPTLACKKNVGTQGQPGQVPSLLPFPVYPALRALACSAALAADPRLQHGEFPSFAQLPRLQRSGCGPSVAAPLAVGSRLQRTPFTFGFIRLHILFLFSLSFVSLIPPFKLP